MNLLKNKELLEVFGNQANLLNSINGGVAATYFDMVENENSIILEVNAPTVDPNSFKIMLNYNQLTIFSTLKDDTVSEIELFSVPMFVKAFELPSFIDFDNIEAINEDERLRIILPFKTSRSNLNRIIEVKNI
ncbi:Hsp20/alpha crystallin family protein [Cytophagaceae bacterium ABcell3]|nr:Hsp20/alpha crystallin family protein [Cytophagaceae bacterium ABcell3]